MSRKYSFTPQSLSYESAFLREADSTMANPLYLSDSISDDLTGIANAIQKNVGVTKILFSGKPGTGKTEAAKFLANSLNRKLFIVSFAGIIDSRLGETLKNIDRLFAQINSGFDLNKTIFLFDELDVIALDRINRNDVREMGRATSAFIKCLDKVDPRAVLLATTNLSVQLDQAIVRRFDFVLDFDRYDKKTLSEIAVPIAKEYLHRPAESGEFKLIEKLVLNSISDFSPGELRNFIRISFAFADPSDKFSYLPRLFSKLYSPEYLLDYSFLREKVGLSYREMERITGVSKSTLARNDEVKETESK